jgi:cytochrome b561
MMQWRNSPQRWGVVAQALHWTIAFMVIGLALVGLLMQEMPNSLDKLKVYSWHKSFGLTVLVLVVLRLAWRLLNRRPLHPPHLPAWQRRLAATTHGLLYLLLFAMPLTGWLYNSASNFPLRWFNLMRIPPLAAPDPELKALALSLHSGGFYLLAALFALHVAGALKHHYFERDRTLVAMLSFQKREGTP